MKKNYVLAAVIILVMVFAIYIYPFLLFNMNFGDIEGMLLQLSLVLILSLPALALMIKKPNKIWIYVYPVVLLITGVYNYTSKDALASGFMILLFALPASIIYTVLVMKNIFK